MILTMASGNPYQPGVEANHQSSSGVRTVDVRVFELLREGWDLIGDQYGLFLGISFLGILIGSVVPMGLLLGPMMIGIYLCFRMKRLGHRVEFGLLFKGFDQFGEALIAWICMVVASFLIMIPVVLIFMALIIGAAVLGEGNDEVAGVGMMAAVFVGYPLIILGSVAVYVPFLFTFPIMARQRIGGWDAIQLSWKGVKQNLWGVVKFVLVTSFLSFVLALMCYVPAILFMPIALAAIHVLFEKVYGMETPADPAL